MASTELSSCILKSKFRGCLMGALVGDCLGIPFEFKNFEINGSIINILLPPKAKVNDFMMDVLNEESTKTLNYTDDTAMTINVASSLIENGEINAKDMAEKFVADFFNQKISRGYGTHVGTVFRKLKVSEFADVFLPAKEQFIGSGSFGNGAPMRIAPIALFGYNKEEVFLVNAAKTCSLITHAHPNGYRGGILQCFAVRAALKLDPTKDFDADRFIDDLLEKMEKIERGTENPYCHKLKKIKEYLNQEDVSSEEIAKYLGNGDDVSALESVPTAIYSFIRGMKPLKFKHSSENKFVPAAVYSFFKGSAPKTYFESSNPFMRTIFFAISVGGDTDTIASMAGAIAGAYYGEDVIPKVVWKKCEAADDIIALADKLYDVTFKDK